MLPLIFHTTTSHISHVISLTLWYILNLISYLILHNMSHTLFLFYSFCHSSSNKSHIMRGNHCDDRIMMKGGIMDHSDGGLLWW
jgi:hypothetical protein